MTKISRIRSWIMLCLAIALEIAGLSLLQVFEESPVLSKVILVCFMNASYFLMSLALRQISVGVAYAAWEIIGGIGVLFVMPYHKTARAVFFNSLLLADKKIKAERLNNETELTVSDENIPTQNVT